MVAPTHGRHPPDPHLIECAAERAEILRATSRRRISPVGQRVHQHPAYSASRGQPDERLEMPLVGVHPSVREEADQVQRPIAGGAGVDHRRESGVGLERASRDRLVDARQILEHDPAGAQVHVSDLGIAHLADG